MHAESLEVEFPKRFKSYIVQFSREIKLREDSLFFEVSPRLIHGLINLSMAYARLNLRKVVTLEDLKKARYLVLRALENKVG